MKKYPRFSGMLENDVPVMVSMIFALLIPAAVLIIERFLAVGRQTSPEWESALAMIVISAIALVAVAVLSWRLWLIYAMFNRDVEVPAKITKISLPRIGFGEIHFEYTYKKNNYTAKSYIFRNLKTINFEIDSRIKLVIDPARPGRILIRDLYL
ncbi:MAG: hypothetical protein LWX83_15305 [Anaerolineae bacterium]|nr:hypothetical protein [Anaerolineae bacterium]